MPKDWLVATILHLTYHVAVYTRPEAEFRRLGLSDRHLDKLTNIYSIAKHVYFCLRDDPREHFGGKIKLMLFVSFELWPKPELYQFLNWNF